MAKILDYQVARQTKTGADIAERLLAELEPQGTVVRLVVLFQLFLAIMRSLPEDQRPHQILHILRHTNDTVPLGLHLRERQTK